MSALSLYEIINDNAWNIRHLVDESFVPANQQTSVLYCRLTDFYIQSGLPKVSYLAPPEASPATRGRIVICKIGCKRNSYSPIWFAHWYLIWKTRVCQLHFFIGLQNKWDWFDATLYFFKFKTKTGSKRGQKVAGRGDEHDHWPFWWFKDRFCI